MAEGENINEGPDDRQIGTHPIGHALRATYDAEHHDSLGSDLTGLMLELARVADEPPPVAPARSTVPPPSPAPISWLRRLLGRSVA